MRTLVVRLDGAGDVLLAGPAVRAVAAASSFTAMLCGPEGAWAARMLPGVDEVLVHEAAWVGASPPPVRSADLAELIDRLAVARFDRALILVSFHQSPLPAALILRLAGIGWIGADCVDYPGALLDLRHARRPGRHEAAAALDLVEAAGFGLPAGDDGRLRVIPPPDTRALTDPQPYLVVHPGASAPARTWSADRAARAVRTLSPAYRVVVTGGPLERELTATVAGDRGLDLGGRTDPAELAGVLANAQVVITGNTGPAHLAAAVGTPVVSLFAPVVPVQRWAPYRVPHIVLGRADAACAGTRARTCPVPGHPCLDSVTDTEVLAAVTALTRPGRPAGRTVTQVAG